MTDDNEDASARLEMTFPIHAGVQDTDNENTVIGRLEKDDMRLVGIASEAGCILFGGIGWQLIIGKRLEAAFKTVTISPRLFDAEGLDGIVSDPGEISFGQSRQPVVRHSWPCDVLRPPAKCRLIVCRRPH